MKRWIVRMMGCGVLALSVAGCATMNDLRYPLPEPSGPKWQLNQSLWQWHGPESAAGFDRGKT